MFQVESRENYIISQYTKKNINIYSIVTDGATVR